MVVSYIAATHGEDLMNINRLQDQARISRNCGLVGRFARLQKIDAVIGGQDQLLCFTDPLTPAKGFSWMQQPDPAGQRLSLSLHHNLVMVCSNIASA